MNEKLRFAKNNGWKRVSGLFFAEWPLTWRHRQATVDKTLEKTFATALNDKSECKMQMEKIIFLRICRSMPNS